MSVIEIGPQLAKILDSLWWLVLIGLIVWLSKDHKE